MWHISCRPNVEFSGTKSDNQMKRDYLKFMWLRKSAFITPAFEVSDSISDHSAKTREQLLELQQKKLARQFHVETCPHCHHPANYRKAKTKVNIYDPPKAKSSIFLDIWKPMAAGLGSWILSDNLLFVVWAVLCFAYSNNSVLWWTIQGVWLWSDKSTVRNARKRLYFLHTQVWPCHSFWLQNSIR